MLIKCPTDPCRFEDRLEWLRPFIESGVRLTLFLDSQYYEALLAAPWFRVANHPDLKLVTWSLESSETWRICGSKELALPADRNDGKDSSFYMKLINAKVELAGLVAAETDAPFVAFLDAGIRKVFRNPEESFSRLRNLRMRADLSGTVVPGCWPPEPWSQEKLARKVCWIFCGGFFVTPRGEAGRLAARAAAALESFVASGRLTWEVNVWVHMMCLRDSPEIHWFAADHNDRMTMVPAEYLEASM